MKKCACKIPDDSVDLELNLGLEESGNFLETKTFVSLISRLFGNTNDIDMVRCPASDSNTVVFHAYGRGDR